MNLLLLSLNAGALPGFLRRCTGREPSALRLGFIDDAGEVLTARVRAGLPYIGLSAGSVVAGPNIEPVAPLDDPAEAPGVTDFTGLGLVDTVVIPHADGALPPYPRALIDEVVRTYGARFPLTRVDDDQALLVENGTATLIPSPIT